MLIPPSYSGNSSGSPSNWLWTEFLHRESSGWDAQTTSTGSEHLTDVQCPQPVTIGSDLTWHWHEPWVIRSQVHSSKYASSLVSSDHLGWVVTSPLYMPINMHIISVCKVQTESYPQTCVDSHNHFTLSSEPLKWVLQQNYIISKEAILRSPNWCCSNPRVRLEVLSIKITEFVTKQSNSQRTHTSTTHCWEYSHSSHSILEVPHTTSWCHNLNPSSP